MSHRRGTAQARGKNRVERQRERLSVSRDQRDNSDWGREREQRGELRVHREPRAP